MRARYHPTSGIITKQAPDALQKEESLQDVQALGQRDSGGREPAPEEYQEVEVDLLYP